MKYDNDKDYVVLPYMQYFKNCITVELVKCICLLDENRLKMHYSRARDKRFGLHVPNPILWKCRRKILVKYIIHSKSILLNLIYFISSNGRCYSFRWHSSGFKCASKVYRAKTFESKSFERFTMRLVLPFSLISLHTLSVTCRVLSSRFFPV